MTVLEAVKQSKTPALMHKGSIREAQQMLQPDEEVLCAMTATVSTNPSVDPKSLTSEDAKYVLLVVTNRRIFYVHKISPLCSSSFIPLWEIHSVSKVPAGKYWRVQIQGITKYLSVEGNHKPIEALHNAIQSALANYTAPASASAPTPAASSELNVEELKKLKELYDAGILTQEEFAAKKAKILGI